MATHGTRSQQRPTPALSRRGLIQRIVMGTAALAMIVVATVILVPPSTAPAASLRPGTETSSEVIVRLSGLSPEVLAASGAQADAALRSIQAAKAAAESRRTDAGSIVDGLINAKLDLASVEKRLRRGQGRAGDVAERQTLLSEIDGLESQQQAIIGHVMDAATAELSPALASNLRTIVANADRDVPVYMRAADQTDEQWVALEYSVSSVDVSGRLGEEPDSDAARAVADAIANPAVAAAKMGFEMRLAAIEATWNTTFGE